MLIAEEEQVVEQQPTDQEQQEEEKPFEQQALAEGFIFENDQQGIDEQFADQGVDGGDNGLTIIYDDVPEEVPAEVYETIIVFDETPEGEFVSELIESG